MWIESVLHEMYNVDIFWILPASESVKFFTTPAEHADGRSIDPITYGIRWDLQKNAWAIIEIFKNVIKNTYAEIF